MSTAALPTLGATTSDNAPSSGSSAQATSAASASASGSSASAPSASGSSQVNSATGLPSIGDSSSSSSVSSSISQITGAPSLSSNAPILSLSGLPTLTGIVTYPPASVPPTASAPYMRQSILPQNFVFIIVGAVLAFILVIVVLWRSLTAWSINRSFKKDSVAAYTPLPDYKKKPQFKNENVVDMADLSGTGPKLPKSFNSVPSLFFSPTAEAARQSMIRPSSQHMPGGHYRDGSKS